MQELLAIVRTFDGILELAPSEGSEFPEIGWGDHFFYYAPDGSVPSRGQPYATVVTKNYPGDTASELDAAGRWRVNIHVGKSEFTRLTGEQPRGFTARDYTVVDAVLPHPVYGPLGWIAVVNPGERTSDTVVELLRTAHDAAMGRAQRRARSRDGQLGD